MREGPFRHRAAPFLRPPLAPRWPVCPVSAAKALGSVAPPRAASVPGPLLPRDHVFHLRHLLGHESIFKHHIHRCKNHLGFYVQVHTSKTVPRVSENKGPNFSQSNLSDD